MTDAAGAAVERLGRRVERERRARLEAEAIAEQATRASLHDPLTGLPNRALVIDRLTTALARAERRDGQVVLLFVDLDRFKLVNDSLGHEVGDKLLVELAARLVKTARTGDTVGRFGGDEFVVLCEEVESRESAEAIARRLSAAVAAPLALGGVELRVSASIGIALSAGRADGAESLIRDGDAAMYHAKERGRNRVEVFQDAVRSRDQERLQAESDLRHAVEQGAFELHYQPIVRLGGRINDIVAIEPLVRWRHPERGLVPPREFIPLAEQTGLIQQIDRWVLEQACTQLRTWRRHHGELVPRELSVNLSAVELADEGLAGRVAHTLREADVEASRLTLEITESALVAESEVAHRNLRELHGHGIRIAIDDFGTGYCSLAYLREFAVDTLKIHRSFVADLATSGDDVAIVQAIVAMARALGLRVVAEGIERSEQLRKVESTGCDLAQGYYFGAPLCAGEYQRMHFAPRAA